MHAIQPISNTLRFSVAVYFNLVLGFWCIPLFFAGPPPYPLPFTSLPHLPPEWIYQLSHHTASDHPNLNLSPDPNPNPNPDAGWPANPSPSLALALHLALLTQTLTLTLTLTLSRLSTAHRVRQGRVVDSPCARGRQHHPPDVAAAVRGLQHRLQRWPARCARVRALAATPALAAEPGAANPNHTLTLTLTLITSDPS